MITNIYEKIGVRTWVNASGYFTRLGGSRMDDEVLEAIREASCEFVDMAELQAAASEIIKKHTGAEAGIVTSSATSGITLATAACLAGFDAAKMDCLPDTSSMPNEVVMHRSHRNSYDHAVRAAGAILVEFGLNDRASKTGMRGMEAWELNAAITPNTVALFFAMSPNNEEDLKTFVDAGRAHNLPVILDAAPFLPPVANLQRFVDMGATLVVFSGGKAIRGPQSTGILCGSKDLIASAALQQLDMNVIDGSWNPPPNLIPREKLKGLPHHGIGRGMKVGKEDVVGLLVALERFAATDHSAEFVKMEASLETIANALARMGHVKPTLLSANDTGRRPVLRLQFDEEGLGSTAVAISKSLQANGPPIQLNERDTNQAVLSVDPACLKTGDDALIIEAFAKLLPAASKPTALPG